MDQLARGQHGVFSHAQVRRSGATDDLVHRRIEAGAWLRVAPAVYALASHRRTWRQLLMAATLGEVRALAGGVSSAALHELTGYPEGRLEIAVPRHSNHRSTLAVVRERTGLMGTVVDGIPTLTLCDTFFEIARTGRTGRVARAMDDVLASDRLSIGELQTRYDERSPRLAGMRLMRQLVAERSGTGWTAPASVLEARLYRILDRPGMPRYVRQARVPWNPDQVVDALLVDVPVIIEADGRRWHTRVADFERDRARDRRAAQHGHRTMRFTHEDIRTDPDRVEAEIRAAARAAA